MKRGTRLLIPLLLLGALAPMACGESLEDREEDLRAVARLIAAGDPERCDRMTGDLLAEQYGGRMARCRKDARASRRDEGGPRRVRIEGVVIEDDRAEVNVALGSGSALSRVDYGFVEQDGEWKLFGYEFPNFAGGQPKPGKRPGGDGRGAQPRERDPDRRPGRTRSG